MAGSVVKVIGIGGAGINAVNMMISTEVKGVDFICMDTDKARLDGCTAGTKRLLGGNDTFAPDIFEGCELVVVIAGMGGATGTATAPLIAEAVKKSGKVVIALINTPFDFYDTAKAALAQDGIAELRKNADCVNIISGENALMSLQDDYEALCAGFAHRACSFVVFLSRMMMTVYWPKLICLFAEKHTSNDMFFGSRQYGAVKALASDLEPQRFARCLPWWDISGLQEPGSIINASQVMVCIMTKEYLGEDCRQSIAGSIVDSVGSRCFSTPDVVPVFIQPEDIEGEASCCIVAKGFKKDAVSELLDSARAEGRSLVPYPRYAMNLFRLLEIPLRLHAHHILVHDVAARLLEKLHVLWPGLQFDRELVLFGAATHDIGKLFHPEELSGEGHLHERAGWGLIVALDNFFEGARFAASHASWSESSTIEELLVSLADKIWRGARVPELEDLFVTRIAAVTGRERGEIFSAFDGIMEKLAADADWRLSWQNRFPV